MVLLACAIPAHWRSLHPAVVRVAGQGTPSLLDQAQRAAQQQNIGTALLLRQAASALLIPVQSLGDLDKVSKTNRELAYLGKVDRVVTSLLPSVSAPFPENRPSALDLFLLATNRTHVRIQLGHSRSPGVQQLLKALDFPVQKFVPANQPGGQPFEAVVLISALLYEREQMASGLAQDLNRLVDQAGHDPAALSTLEDFYLGLLTLSRRMDWASLSDLVRHANRASELTQLASLVRLRTQDLSLLFAGVLMSGELQGVLRQWADYGDAGRQAILLALGAGEGAVRQVCQSPLPVRSGMRCPEVLARAVFRAPQAWVGIRSCLWLLASVLAALALGRFVHGGILPSESAPPSTRGIRWVAALLVGLFLILASEPLPPRPRKEPAASIFLDPGALTQLTHNAKSSHPSKNIMEPTTLITVLVFGAIQLAVYFICLRKIREVTRLPEPASVRLKLLENEENLFDSGLYVGIGGTAAALVMQVLQMVEANLLAAYSSNLMGIICVASIKIGHVRSARRQLILEVQAAEASRPRTQAAPVSNPFQTR